jgi:Family of unknown function (DUF6056)
MSRLLAVIVGAPLAAYAYLGLFSRYAADDFCTAGQVATRGLVGLELQLYEAWSGRFAFTFIVGLVELIGAGAARVLPALAILAWVAALTWAISRLGRLLGWQDAVIQALLVAELIVLATLASTPDVGQSLYWQTGMLTYLAPLVVLACWVALVTGRVRAVGAGPGALLASGALAFVAAGTSETYVAAQVAGLVLAGGLGAIALPAPARRVFLPLVAAGLAGSLLAFSIVVLAPGNAVRGGGARPSWAYVASAALDDARQFVHDFYRFSTLQAAITFSVPFGLALFAPPRTPGRAQLGRALGWGALVGLAGLVEVVVCLTPSFYALSAPEPGRARIIPQLVLVCLTALAGYLAGVSFLLLWPRLVVQLRPVVAAVVALTLVSPALITRDVLAEVGEARAYAQRWDGIDAQVRADHAAGLQDVVVRPLAPTGTVRGMDFVGPNPADWLNQCVARYYGIRSIATLEPG